MCSPAGFLVRNVEPPPLALPVGIGNHARSCILRARLLCLRLGGLLGQSRLALALILRIRQIIRLIKPRIRPAVVGQELHRFVLLHAAFEEDVEDVAFAGGGQGGVGAAGGFVAEEFEELLLGRSRAGRGINSNRTLKQQSFDKYLSLSQFVPLFLPQGT
jgi:hypothetical protein